MDIIVTISNILWGWPLVIIILFAAIVLTIQTRAIQFRRFRYMCKTPFLSIVKKGPDEGEGVMNPLKLALTAMAGTIGV